VRYAVIADANSRALSQADPAKQARTQKARRPLLDAVMRRDAAGEHRWVVTLFPTHASASEADMSLSNLRTSTTAPASCSTRIRSRPGSGSPTRLKRLADWMDGKEEVRVQAPGTDITLGVAGRRFIPCFGDKNMPDGEFFTGPMEDAVNGEVAFSFPAIYGGREVSGVRFRFEDGKVVDATAERGEDYLHRCSTPTTAPAA